MDDYQQRRATQMRAFAERQESRTDTALVLVFVAIMVIFAAVSVTELVKLREAVKACTENRAKP